MNELARIAREVADEWRAAGKLHDPPDETPDADDLAFWQEVKRRMAAIGKTARIVGGRAAG